MRKFILLIPILLHATLGKSQCTYNNVYYETKAAPTVVGNSITTQLYGGEYSRITNMQAGYVYQISTCGDNAFDSQITIYQAGGTSPAVAFNDDYDVCTPQSRIYFSPLTTGNYDILIDEYNCANNFSNFINVTVQLFGTPTPIITIPTVVHVVYNNSTENISDAQIQTQINALNQDFRRWNSDISSAPSRFRGFSKDIRVEFCLAKRDPNGNPTNGITRTATSHGAFTTNDDMKYNSTGGKNAWPRNNYLNLWVCNLSGGILGYAQFPGGAAATDGVVIRYQSFGTSGTATPPFNLGRTATHEVGHWLDLRHIWSGENLVFTCDDSDYVNDTPNQDDENTGCPSAPISCSNGGLGGDMYVNYMDYSDDACLTMFTYWQYRRMDATLYGSRSTLKNSLGCQLVTGFNEFTYTAETINVYPNPANSSVTILLNLPIELLSDISFVMYDILGNEIKYINEISTNQFQFSVDNLSSGIYFYNILKNKNSIYNGKIAVN